MIEIRIWTHIGQPTVQVDEHTLSQMQADMEATVIGRYSVLWCTDEKRTLVINWNNVTMLDSPLTPVEDAATPPVVGQRTNDHDHTSTTDASGYGYDFSSE